MRTSFLVSGSKYRMDAAFRWYGRFVRRGLVGRAQLGYVCF